MISERRRLANQQNALRSTGPRTEAGKLRSRRNALKHGLTGQGVVLSRPDHERVNAQLKELTEHLQPVDPLEHILVKRMALAAVRMEKCVKKDLADLARRQRNALARWEARQLEATAQAVLRLDDEPASVVAELESTSFGCEWLLDAWDVLGSALADQGHLTRLQAERGLRLLGHDPAQPFETSSGLAATLWHHALALRPEAADEAAATEAADRASALAALHRIIAGELCRLEQRSEELQRGQDEPARTEVEDRASVNTSAEGARLHRYETAAELSLHRNLNQLLKLRKIEPEHQSIERFHKTGKLKPRRWNGISYEPTNPYYSSSAMDQGIVPVPGAVPGPAEAPDSAPAGPAPAQAPVSAEAEIEAKADDQTSEAACSSDEPEAALELVSATLWEGQVPQAMWPEPPAEEEPAALSDALA